MQTNTNPGNNGDGTDWHAAAEQHLDDHDFYAALADVLAVVAELEADGPIDRVDAPTVARVTGYPLATAEVVLNTLAEHHAIGFDPWPTGRFYAPAPTEWAPTCPACGGRVLAVSFEGRAMAWPCGCEISVEVAADGERAEAEA